MASRLRKALTVLKKGQDTSIPPSVKYAIVEWFFHWLHFFKTLLFPPRQVHAREGLRKKVFGTRTIGQFPSKLFAELTELASFLWLILIVPFKVCYYALAILVDDVLSIKVPTESLKRAAEGAVALWMLFDSSYSFVLTIRSCHSLYFFLVCLGGYFEPTRAVGLTLDLFFVSQVVNAMQNYYPGYFRENVTTRTLVYYASGIIIMLCFLYFYVLPFHVPTHILSDCYYMMFLLAGGPFAWFGMMFHGKSALKRKDHGLMRLAQLTHLSTAWYLVNFTLPHGKEVRLPLLFGLINPTFVFPSMKGFISTLFSFQGLQVVAFWYFCIVLVCLGGFLLLGLIRIRYFYFNCMMKSYPVVLINDVDAGGVVCRLAKDQPMLSLSDAGELFGRRPALQIQKTADLHELDAIFQGNKKVENTFIFTWDNVQVPVVYVSNTWKFSGFFVYLEENGRLLYFLASLFLQKAALKYQQFVLVVSARHCGGFFLYLNLYAFGLFKYVENLYLWLAKWLKNDTNRAYLIFTVSLFLCPSVQVFHLYFVCCYISFSCAIPMMPNDSGVVSPGVPPPERPDAIVFHDSANNRVIYRSGRTEKLPDPRLDSIKQDLSPEVALNSIQQVKNLKPVFEARKQPPVASQNKCHEKPSQLPEENFDFVVYDEEFVDNMKEMPPSAVDLISMKISKLPDSMEPGEEVKHSPLPQDSFPPAPGAERDVEICEVFGGEQYDLCDEGEHESIKESPLPFVIGAAEERKVNMTAAEEEEAEDLEQSSHRAAFLDSN